MTRETPTDAVYVPPMTRAEVESLLATRRGDEQLIAAQDKLRAALNTPPQPPQHPVGAGGVDFVGFLVSVIHGINHSDAVLDAALKRFEQVEETESIRHALAHALDAAVFVARTQKPDGTAPSAWEWAHSLIGEEGEEPVPVGTKEQIEKLTTICPVCEADDSGGGVDEPPSAMATCTNCVGGRVPAQHPPQQGAIDLTIVVSGAPVSVSAASDASVEDVIETALVRLGMPRVDYASWTLRREDGSPIPLGKVADADLTSGATVFLDPDAGGGAAEGQGGDEDWPAFVVQRFEQDDPIRPFKYIVLDGTQSTDFTNCRRYVPAEQGEGGLSDADQERLRGLEEAVEIAERAGAGITSLAPSVASDLREGFDWLASLANHKGEERGEGERLVDAILILLAIGFDASPLSDLQDHYPSIDERVQALFERKLIENRRDPCDDVETCATAEGFEFVRSAVLASEPRVRCGGGGEDRPLIASYWIPPLDPMFGTITVERTGAIVDGEASMTADVWAVRRGAACLARDGEWTLEPLPSSRTDEWLAQHRYTLAEAIPAAEAVQHPDCSKEREGGTDG